ncbi:MAG: Gfo/Idh/MocA family oxidoreductase [Phycisphaeraceae bacterium]|nr:MAG: Gfo/Idh/MocA family oxidoreductase [Phycisphaeraceae bacterium]
MTEIDRRDFLVQSAGALAAVAIMPRLGFGAMSLAEPINVGVIGLGRQGRAIIAELSGIEGTSLGAVCDSDERRLAAGSRRARDAKAVGDARAIFDDASIGAVCIATPTHLHRELVEQALQAGKHVYCEAPMAHTIEDCRAIVRAARGAATVFQPGLFARSDPVYQLARTFFRSDAVRDLVSMNASRAKKTSWRTPADDPARDRALNWRLDPEVSIGLAGEWGTHQFDVFHYYLDRFPVEVSGRGGIRLHDDGREIADTIDCVLGYEDGADLVYQATLASSYGGMFELLRGTNAAIKLAWSHGWMFKEADAPTQGWEVYANRQQFHNDEGITLIAGATKLAEQGKLKEGVGLPYTPLRYGLADFLKAATEGGSPATSAEEGLRATVVGIMADKAVRGRTTVAIEPDMLRA